MQFDRGIPPLILQLPYRLRFRSNKIVGEQEKNLKTCGSSGIDILKAPWSIDTMATFFLKKFGNSFVYPY